jgi:hypothetical protein
MRYFDEDEASRLNAEPWQLALLKANPSYLGWGPHEDYMWKEGEGWNSRVIVPTWAEFGPWELDDLNEFVNFYFEVNRASEDCKTCGGNGYHPDAQRVVNTFYQHQCPSVGASPVEAWNDKITLDEVQALVEAGRLRDFTAPTAEEVNAAQHKGGFGSHDAINRMILIEARLKRLGLPHNCPACDGHGSVFTEPAAHASLVLWWLHPRKGCSRGIEVTTIQQADLPAIAKFLREAADRNATRFAGISQLGA